MTVWDKGQFKTQSKKYWSKRDGTIKEIDDQLDVYHLALQAGPAIQELKDLHTLIMKFIAEKKLKYANNPGGQSKKRKDAVDALRLQVEPILWQADYESKAKERSDLKAYLKKKGKNSDDQDVLTDWLEALKIQVKQGEDATNVLQRKLHTAIHDYFDTNGPKLFLPLMNFGFPWSPPKVGFAAPYVSAIPPKPNSGSTDPIYSITDPLRVASVDLKSVVGGDRVKYVMLGTKGDPDWATDKEKSAIFFKVFEEKESLISAKQSEHQVAEHLPADVRTVLEDYLRSLLTVDLADQVKLVERALESEDGFRAVVHIDYYATRNTMQVGLHKDTTGNNLFAVLHYINDAPMLGPEYIDDPAAIKTMNPGFYDERYWSTIGDAYRRQAAPWAKIGVDKYVWPEPLLEALHFARYSTKPSVSRGKMASSMLPKDGLVCFVDELIFHATPIIGHRVDATTEEAVRFLSAGVTVTSLHKDGKNHPGAINMFGTKTHVTRVERRMSAHYDNGVHLETGLGIPGSTSGGVRKFFRLWISIVPKHWYTVLPAYT